MKRLTIYLLLACMLFSVIPAAYAQETTDAATETAEPVREADQCGENLFWSYADGVLTVSGTGAMDDMTGGAPWAQHADSITAVVLTGGVTTVGAEAFRGCSGITSIDFGSALNLIDTRAFQNCTGITSIHLPATFKRFGQECFQGCSSLKEVHCAGGMPSFNSNCLWTGDTITVYCPANNVWPESYVQELETNFGGRLQILTSDGEDPFDFTEATEPATESATEPTTEPTEPETEPVTEETIPPTTEETVPPTTEDATEPATEEPTAQTEAAAQPEAERTGSAAGVAIVVMLLSGLGIGAIVFYLKTGKGGKYAA